MKTHRVAVVSALLLLTFHGVALAQNNASPEPLVKVLIGRDTFAQTPQSALVVSVTIENTSGRDIDFTPVCSFELRSLKKEALTRRIPAVGDGYWSPVNITTGTPVDLNIIDSEKLKQGVVVGRVPRESLHLAKNEVKTFNVDLTKTFWNDRIRSVWPNQSLSEVVPKGSYSLVFQLQVDTANLRSNELKVSLN
jgi:hypothetical protein